ncbi:MAG: hypothetical protein MJZ41_12510 [Bacteroidaceae bacterium]|nr:hypothetical protein [Bacteroidaceae bacterium]
MKHILFIVTLFITLCSFAQQERTMSDMIKYCIEDYCYRDSLIAVEGIWVQDPTKIKKIVCLDGLPRGFDISSMPDYTFHRMNKQSVKETIRKIKSRSFGTLFVSINLEQDEFYISINSASVYIRFFGRIIHVLWTDDVRKYQYKYDSQKGMWILIPPQKKW